MNASVKPYDLIMNKWNKMKEAPTDPVTFANTYLPINPDSKRPDFGPDLPDSLANWLKFATGYLDPLDSKGKVFKKSKMTNKYNIPYGGIIGPPGFGKTLISERAILWWIVDNRNLTGAYVTKTESKAKEFTGVIKERLESKKLTDVYGLNSGIV